jgi:hypothetical protein
MTAQPNTPQNVSELAEAKAAIEALPPNLRLAEGLLASDAPGDLPPHLIRSARIAGLCLVLAVSIAAWATAIYVAMRVVGQ